MSNIHRRLEGTLPKATRRDDPDQSKAFIEKAREIGADEEHSAADKSLGQLATLKPHPREVISKNE
jgi:hypothetical protein